MNNNNSHFSNSPLRQSKRSNEYDDIITFPKRNLSPQNNENTFENEKFKASKLIGTPVSDSKTQQISLKKSIKNQENSPLMSKIELSNVHISNRKEAISIPIQIYSRGSSGRYRFYGKTMFEYNENMEKITDFSHFDWVHYHKDDFISLLAARQWTPRDFLKFYKNNYKDSAFMKLSESQEKLMEMVHLDTESGSVRLLQYSHDHSLIVSSGNNDNIIRVWDARDMKYKGSLEGHEETITNLYLCRNSKGLLSASQDFSVKAWDLDNFTEIASLENVHIEEITKISMNSLENRLFTSSKDGQLKIIDWKKQIVLKVFEEHSRKAINDFCLCAEDSYMISCGNDKTIRVFDNLHNPLYKSSFNIKSSTNQNFLQIHSFLLNKQRKILALTSDSNVILYDFKLHIQERVIIPQFHRIVLYRLLPNNSQIITYNENKVLQIWSLINGKEIVKKQTNLSILCMDLIDRRPPIEDPIQRSYPIQMITGSEEGYINIWRIADIEETTSLIHQRRMITLALLSLDNRYMIYASENNINIFDMTSNRVEKTLSGHIGSISALCISPDSKVLVSGSTDAMIKIWDLESNGHEESLKKHMNEIICIEISYEGNYMASSANDQTLCIYDFVKRVEKANVKNIGVVRHMSFSDICLYTAGSEGIIKQWKIKVFSEIRAFSAHTKEIVGLKYIVDGKRLISAGYDKIVKVWECEGEMTPQLIRIIYNKAEIEGLMATSDGKTICFHDSEGFVKNYCIETGGLEKEKQVIEEKIKGICLFHDNKKMLIWEDKGGCYIYEFNEPMFSKSLVLNEMLENIDDDDKLYDLVKKSLWETVFIDFIYPIKANILHYLAYMNRDDMRESEKLRRLLRILTKYQRMPLIFQTDIFGNTPMDILFDQKDITTAFYFLNIAIEHPPELHCFENVGEIVDKAAKMGFRNINKLIDSRILPIRHISIQQNEQKDLYENHKDEDFLLMPSGYFEGVHIATLKHSVITLPEELIAANLIRHPRAYEPVYSAKLEILDIPNILNFSRKSHDSELFDSLVKLNNSDIYTSRSLQFLIDYKWDKYAHSNFYLHLFCYVITLLVLLVYSVWLLPLRVRYVIDFSHITDYALVNLIFLCFLSFFTLIYLIYELYRFVCFGPIYYFSFVKNIYFLLNLCLFIVMLIFDWLGLFKVYFDEDLIRNLHAFNLYFYIYGLLFYMKAFESFSFGRLLFKIIENIKIFIVLFVCLIYAFGFIIWILDKSWSFDENYDDSATVAYWKQPFETFDIVYRIMIRDYSIYNSDPKPLYSIILWVFFLLSTFFIIVVMLNAFIAIIFDLQQNLQRKGREEMLKERIYIIRDIDKMLFEFEKWNLKKSRFFQKYLFISTIFEVKNPDISRNELNIAEEKGDIERLERMESRIMERIGDVERKINAVSRGSLTTKK